MLPAMDRELEVAWTQHISYTSILHSATNHGTMYTWCLSCYHPAILHFHIYLYCFCKAAAAIYKSPPLQQGHSNTV